MALNIHSHPRCQDSLDGIAPGTNFSSWRSRVRFLITRDLLGNRPPFCTSLVEQRKTHFAFDFDSPILLLIGAVGSHRAILQLLYLRRLLVHILSKLQQAKHTPKQICSRLGNSKNVRFGVLLSIPNHVLGHIISVSTPN